MDKALLEYEMKKRGVTIADMCAKLGISEFTQSEIQTIVDYLGLESPVGIFFTSKVS